MHLCLRTGPVSAASQRAECYSTVTAGSDPQSDCRQRAVWRVTVNDMVTIAMKTLLTTRLRVGARNDVIGVLLFLTALALVAPSLRSVYWWLGGDFSGDQVGDFCGSNLSQ